MSDPDEVMEMKCPTCREKVKITVREAEQKKKARCSKGHEFPLVEAS